MKEEGPGGCGSNHWIEMEAILPMELWMEAIQMGPVLLLLVDITLFTRSLGGENCGCEGIQNADVVNSYLKSIYTW